jgi:hypothetical protein
LLAGRICRDGERVRICRGSDGDYRGGYFLHMITSGV